LLGTAGIPDPGGFLREAFLIPLWMTVRMLASEIKAPMRRVVAIVERRRGLAPEMCLRWVDTSESRRNFG
jgi:plasmid maintenance system antidote protein VapI